MGIASTLRVSRETALLAMAKIKFGHMSDVDIESALDSTLQIGQREALNNVSITYDNRSENDEELQRLIDNHC